MFLTYGIPGDIDLPILIDEVGHHRRAAARHAGLRVP